MFVWGIVDVVVVDVTMMMMIPASYHVAGECGDTNKRSSRVYDVL